MKLTVHPSDVLPDGFAHFFDAVTISLAAGCTARRHTVNFTIQPVGIVAPLQNFFYRPKESKSFNGTVSQKNISLFGGLNYNTTVDVAEFADSCHSVSQIAGRRIFFRTRIPKTSDELFSLSTGLCYVRVKNKATSETTLLQHVKI